MPLLPCRKPENFNFSSPQIALQHIKILEKHQQIAKCSDAIVCAVKQFPSFSISFLALAQQIFSNAKDKSRYNLYQERIYNFDIRPSDKVLDIGSGHIPFPLATHLADISLTDNMIGRAGAAFRQIKGRPTYECSVELTPFADKEFDFVYCSHVLEHVPNPSQACKELIRIAKRGYIETPSKSKDIFLCSAIPSNHISYTEIRNGILTFNKYEKYELEGIGYNILQHMHSNPQTEREAAFSALMYLFPLQVNTMILWEGSFQFNSSY